jgi:hypothetical protein
MLDLALTDFMEIWSPLRIGGKIVGDTLGEQNVTGVAAIHNPLGEVNSSTGEICPLIDVGNLIDGPTMDTHPNQKTRVVSQGAADLQCALCWGFRGVAENQRHPISTRQAQEPALIFRLAKLVCPADDCV